MQEERESEEVLNKALVGDMPEPWTVGQGPIGSQLGKGPIESGIS